MANTYTNTSTYTTTRIQVLDDHFEMFLTCANMEPTEIEKLIGAVERHELCAVGIYIEDAGYRVAEVEFAIDWEEHERQVNIHGKMFDADLPGYKNNVSPEAYVAAQRLVKAAKSMNKPVRSWIRVTHEVYKDVEKHKKVCNELGYSFGSTVSPWKNPPVTRERQIGGLPEAKTIQRTVS